MTHFCSKVLLPTRVTLFHHLAALAPAVHSLLTNFSSGISPLFCFMRSLKRGCRVTDNPHTSQIWSVQSPVQYDFWIVLFTQYPWFSTIFCWKLWQKYATFLHSYDIMGSPNLILRAGRILFGRWKLLLVHTKAILDFKLHNSSWFVKVFFLESSARGNTFSQLSVCSYTKLQKVQATTQWSRRPLRDSHGITRCLLRLRQHLPT